MRKWRKSNEHYGGAVKDEPRSIYETGSSQLYKSGAAVIQLTRWQRKNVYFHAPEGANFALECTHRMGHLQRGKKFRGFSETVEEGKCICEKWLDEQEKSDDSTRR